MIANRSIPDTVVIPELAYPDVVAAAAWLEGAFGLSRRLVIGAHRVQLTVPGGGAVVAVEARAGDKRRGGALLVRVEDANAHHARAVQRGARIVRPLEDHPFGERQYTAADPGGHVWTFSQSLADVDPAAWGGVFTP